MKALENLGIYDEGANALQHNDRIAISKEQFFNETQTLLGRLGAIAAEDIIPNLRERYGRWHPSGFMVYPLGAHRDLGTLRLHLWPAGLRQREEKGLGPLDDICDGDIHNHSWHISSLVLNGVYADNMYEVREVGNLNETYDPIEVARKGLWNVFQVRYRQGSQPEGLYATGSVVDAVIDNHRVVQTNDFHTIEAGPFHAPTIPEGLQSATLVFNSKRVMPGGPDILISGTALPIVGNRVDVKEEEAKLVEEQFS